MYAAPPATGSSTASSCRPGLPWPGCSGVARTRTRYPLWMSPGSQSGLARPNSPVFPRAASMWMQKYRSCKLQCARGGSTTNIQYILQVALEKKGTSGLEAPHSCQVVFFQVHVLSTPRDPAASWDQSSSSLAPTLDRPIQAFLSIPSQKSNSKSHVPTLPSLLHLPLFHQYSV